MNSSSPATKTKDGQMGLHEVRKLLHNKRNGFKIEDITHRVGENICWLYIRQKTDNQNIQGTQKTKLPTNQ
jgi:hypothetical protein